MMRFRIAWKSYVTGQAGHGEWKDGEPDAARDYASAMDKKYPELEHWVEGAPPEACESDDDAG